MKWLLFCTIAVFITPLFSQINLENPALTSHFKTFKLIKRHRPALKPSESAKIKSVLMSPSNFYLKSMFAENAFFCRLEDAIAKSSKINFKFRLGSVNYVDALEGKGYHEVTAGNRVPVRARK